MPLDPEAVSVELDQVIVRGFGPAALDALRRLEAAGVGADEVLAQLDRKLSSQPENDEVIRELMDIASGWCGPANRVWP